MPEQEGLGDLLSHEGLECPSAIRRRDEPRAGCDTPNSRCQTRAVDAAPKLPVPPQDLAPILVDADLGSTSGTAWCWSRGGVHGLLSRDPFEEAVGVGEQGATARVDKGEGRVFGLGGVADPARLVGRVDAHGARRCGCGCGCGWMSGREEVLVIVVCEERVVGGGGEWRALLPSIDRLLRRHLSPLWPERERAWFVHLVRVGPWGCASARSRPSRFQVGLAEFNRRSYALRMVLPDAPGSQGTSSLIGVALAIGAGILIALGLNVQRRVQSLVRVAYKS